ncbi:hypothetical protein HSHS1_01420 [Helicobacter suis HS1]|nr:hypothetical protein HSHS1_01420 [Helicobacter suis HS1]
MVFASDAGCPCVSDPGAKLVAFAQERNDPSILNGSRKKRIALGCGLEVAEINRILKRFDQVKDLAKKMSSKGGVAHLLQTLQQTRMPKR